MKRFLFVPTILAANVRHIATDAGAALCGADIAGGERRKRVMTDAGLPSFCRACRVADWRAQIGVEGRANGR